MYDNLVNRLHRYSESCVAYKLDADFASAVQEAADVIERKDAIPVEWMVEKLTGHPELSYTFTDGIISVIDAWNKENGITLTAGLT